MDIRARLSDRQVKQEFIEVLVTPKDAGRIIDVIHAIKKRSKLDRYEETVIDDLLMAFAEPERHSETVAAPGAVYKDSPATVTSSAVISPEVDKRAVVDMVKKRIRNEKSMPEFIQESIVVAQTQFGITTVPLEASEEAFYDWLVLNNIINPDGSPTNRASKRT